MMKNKEIEQAETELCDIEKLNKKEKFDELKKWLDRYGISYSTYSRNDTW